MNLKPTDEVKRLAKILGDLEWNPVGTTGTGWHTPTGMNQGANTYKVMYWLYAKNRDYFTRLANDADHEDWSEHDQALFDAARELELLVCRNGTMPLNDSEALFCGLGGPYEK
jgi:hypothetical protein